MRRISFLRGPIVGIIVGVVTLLALNAFVPADGIAIAQDETPVPPTRTPVPTVAPTLTPTPLPSLAINATAELAPEGDTSGDGIANPGDTILYTIRVSNSGSASGPMVFTVSYDQSFVSGVAAISSGGAAGEGQVIWNLPGMASGEELTVTFHAALKGIFPSGRTQVTGSAIVRAGSVELARAGLPAVEVVGPNLRFVDQISELITDADENGRIDPGDTVRFIISYSNTGGGPSQEASIIATYPADFTREIVGNPDNAVQQDGTLVWTLGSVPADGEVRSVQFSVTLASEFPAETTTYDLGLSLKGVTAVIDASELSVNVSGPNLLLSTDYEFTVDQGDDQLVDPGDEVNVALAYENVGTDAASNVALSLTYNPERIALSGLPADVAHDAEAGTVQWIVPSLEAGVGDSISFVVTILEFPEGTLNLRMTASISSDQTAGLESVIDLPVLIPTPTPEPEPTAEPLIQEVRPAQGQGILGGSSVAILIGAFLMLSLLSLAFVASRVLPSNSDERAELDTDEEKAVQRRLVRELIEGVILTAILFSVMILGLQNALDQDSVNSIIAGIVGYVAGRVSSQK